MFSIEDQPYDLDESFYLAFSLIHIPATTVVSSSDAGTASHSPLLPIQCGKSTKAGMSNRQERSSIKKVAARERSTLCK